MATPCRLRPRHPWPERSGCRARPAPSRLRAVSLGDGLVLLVGERDLSRLFVAVAQIGQFDLVAGLERADAAGEIRRRPSTTWPLSLVITSPALSPASAAGVPGIASATIAPLAVFMPRLSAISGGDRLDVDAEIAARNDPAVLERADDAIDRGSRGSQSQCRRCRPTASRWRCSRRRLRPSC